jgi:hypothetical protein
MARRFGGSFLLLAVCAIGALAHAQSALPIAFGKSVVPLNGPWKFQISYLPTDPQTGEPLWAEPGSDDSHWETVDLTPQPGIVNPFDGDRRYVHGWTAKGHSGYWGYAWYRIRVPLIAESDERLALATYGRVDDAYQLFDHGVLVGSWGRFRGNGESPVTYFTEPVMILLPKSPSLSLSGAAAHAGAGPAERVLTVRFWIGPVGLAHDPYAGGFHSAPLLGEAGEISARVQLERLRLFRQLSFSAFEAVLFFMLTIATAGLTFFDRSDRVYLWIAGTFLLLATYMGNYVLAGCTQLESFKTYFVIFQVFANPLLFWRMGFDLVGLVPIAPSRVGTQSNRRTDDRPHGLDGVWAEPGE